MLHRAQEIKNLYLRAKDGQIGRAKEFYFDDQSWTVRYLVADTGKWLATRQVLISPFAVRAIRENDKSVEVTLTRDQIESSPLIDLDKPLSRQFEEEYYRYYQWPFYWQGTALWGPLPRPSRSYGDLPAPPAQSQAQEPGDPHLRSTREVTGYRIQATDGEIGHVEDFVIDDEDWVIEYLVVDTANWLPGKKVLVPPAWAEAVNWEESKVGVNLDRQTLKEAPEFNAAKLIDPDYEDRLFRYYDRSRAKKLDAAA